MTPAVRHATDAALAAALAVLAAGHALAACEQGRPVVGTLLVSNDLVLAGLVLRRTPPRRVSRSAADRLACAVTLLLPLAMRPEPSTAWPAAGAALHAAGLALAIAAAFALGPRLGLLPADRGLAARGPYAVVRHPMYGAWLLATAGYLVAAPSVGNAVAAVATAALLVWRALREEALLEDGEAYAAYRRRVPCRFVPGVF